jgi:ketosteroid isomerase-like protein
VVVYLRVSGSGPSSGITIDNDVAGLLTFRDGKIAEYQIYLDRSEALKAAQLTDRDVAS